MTLTETPLTTQEHADLVSLEKRIRAGFETFLDVGAALLEVRDRRLYRATHSNWATYCEERWGWSERHANRLIGAFEVQTNVGPIGLTLNNEAQARPLASLPPEDQQLIARFVRATTQSNQPTAAELQALAATVRDLHNTATVAHPETGEPTPWADLPPEHRGAVLAAAVTSETHNNINLHRHEIERGKAPREFNTAPFPPTDRPIPPPTVSPELKAFYTQAHTILQLGAFEGNAAELVSSALYVVARDRLKDLGAADFTETELLDAICHALLMASEDEVLALIGAIRGARIVA